jgi:plasmid stabilization system protein ParE
MAYNVVIHERAKNDLAEAFGYIHKLAPDAAIRWYHRIQSDLDSLSEMPSRCPMVPECGVLDMELRHLITGKRAGRYRIVFSIDEATQDVHVLTVRHRAMRALEPRDIE